MGSTVRGALSILKKFSKKVKNFYLKEVRLGSAVIKTFFCGFPDVETCKTTPNQPSRYKKQAPKMRSSFLKK